MREKKKRISKKYSERPFRKYQDESPDKRHPNPDDPYEETGPPIKEMPTTSGQNYHEESPDRPQK